MKKFTKVCLLTALILLIVGIAFCSLFGMAGGYSQLESIRGSNDLTVHLGNLQFGIPYRFWHFGIWDNAIDWRWDILTGGKELVGHEKTRIFDHGDQIRDITIDAGGANLVIKESEDDDIWLENRSSSEKVRYEADSDRITVQAGYRRRIFGLGSMSDSSGEIYLYLPKDMALDTIEMEIGGGKLDSIGLTASEIYVELGGGKMVLDSLSADSVELEIGAGKVDLKSLNAGYAELEVGAGKLSVNDMDVSELVLDVGTGKADLEGKITDYANMACGVGNLDILLTGNERDYDYNLECAIGKVNIGSNRYSGLASERYVNNDSRRLISIDCAVGTVNVDFKN